MSVTYNTATLNARLTDVVTQIGTGAYFVITDASSNELVRMPMASTAGTVSAGVLTISGTPLTATASGTGTAAYAKIISGSSTPVFGLTVVATSTGDVQLSPTAISSGQTVNLGSGSITGR
jgi:hypothetical protein